MSSFFHKPVEKNKPKFLFSNEQKSQINKEIENTDVIFPNVSIDNQSFFEPTSETKKSFNSATKSIIKTNLPISSPLNFSNSLSLENQSDFKIFKSNKFDNSPKKSNIIKNQPKIPNLKELLDQFGDFENTTISSKANNFVEEALNTMKSIQKSPKNNFFLNDFENTNIVFPSPSQDTKSKFDFTPEINKNNNKFESKFNFKGKPPTTSPLEFSPSIDNENNEDFKLFKPKDFNKENNYDNEFKLNIKIPTIKEFLNEFLDYEKININEKIENSLKKFFLNINYGLKFEIFIPSYKIISNNLFNIFLNSFNEIKDNVKQLKEATKLQESLIKQHPPQLILSLSSLNEEDLILLFSIINGYSSVVNCDTTLNILEKLLLLEQINSNDCDKIENLKKFIEKNKNNLLNNNNNFQINELNEIKSNILNIKNNNEKLKDFFNKFELLEKIISFKINQLIKNEAKIILPFINQEIIINNSLKGHCLVSKKFRLIELQEEINEIKKLFSFVSFESNQFQCIISLINLNIRFLLKINISLNYPFCKLIPETDIYFGNIEKINLNLKKIFNNKFIKKILLKNLIKIKNLIKL